MSKSRARQYTIRNVPDDVDRILRERARTTHRSFNQVALDALIDGVGARRPKRNVSGIAGMLSDEDAAAITEEIRRQHQIDPEMWR